MVTTYEKVVDFTYNQGTVSKLKSDIGIVTDCLQQCTQMRNCLSVLLTNDRGGIQTCSSLNSSAINDESELVGANNGQMYFEKVCLSEFSFRDVI